MGRLCRIHFSCTEKEGFEIAACGSRYHQQVAASGMYHAYDPNAHSYIGVLEEFRRILKLITISRQVSQRNQELLQMMNYSFEAIWVTDDHGHITSYNVKAAGLFAKIRTKPLRPFPAVPSMRFFRPR